MTNFNKKNKDKDYFKALKETMEKYYEELLHIKGYGEFNLTYDWESGFEAANQFGYRE